MEMKVFWTQTALNDIENIFEYYKYKASPQTARKLVKEIVKAAFYIRKSPQIGKTEELLIERKFEYRFLVTGNYKIIYWIENNYIKIATVFDTRQNPEKIKKT
jgi:plasmid stabilization system protein ParE